MKAEYPGDSTFKIEQVRAVAQVVDLAPTIDDFEFIAESRGFRAGGEFYGEL